MSAAYLPVCSPEQHEHIRTTPELWARCTPLGMQEQGEGYPPLELRNCFCCPSTLAIELPMVAEAA